MGDPKNSGRYLERFHDVWGAIAGHQVDEGEEGLRRDRMTVVEHVESHRVTPSLVCELLG